MGPNGEVELPDDSRESRRRPKRQPSTNPKAIARRERAQARCEATGHEYQSYDYGHAMRRESKSAIVNGRCGKCGAEVK